MHSRRCIGMLCGRVTMGEIVLIGATTYAAEQVQLDRLCAWLDRTGRPSAVFDNSPAASDRARVAATCARASGIAYLSQGSNCGVAEALNRLLREADRRGAEWLLYFDQDSEPQADFLDLSLSIAESVPSDVVLIGCNIRPNGGIASDHSAGSPEALDVPAIVDVREIINSGTLMRVAPLVKGGGFDSSFFVDLVDHEVSWRMRRLGFRVVRDLNRTILHSIGTDSVKLPIARISVTRHPWWRRRQMWRNTLVMACRYWRFDPAGAARLVLGRALETVAATIYFRDIGFVTTAVRGICDALTRRVSPTPRRE